MDEPVTPIVILGLAMFAAGRYRTDRWAFAAPVGATLAPFGAKWLDYPGEVDVTDALFILFPRCSRSRSAAWRCARPRPTSASRSGCAGRRSRPAGEDRT